eukprot:TRINITY_DN8634_c0_g1_i1.p1 TRINITY_DN8634_c0_g1~~TRINITY_DN8634_c0_g1_i1.p1  ORF type:complete len:239 (+),score=31.16 TRINITY_DN8634_c0_g1_i1:122-838(+)
MINLAMPSWLCLIALLVIALLSPALSSSCGDTSSISDLMSSTDMGPVQGNTTIKVPFDILSTFVSDVVTWPSWNSAVASSSGSLSDVCETITFNFHLHSIPKWPLTLPSSCLILNSTMPSYPGAVEWQYGGPGLFGVHTTTIEPLPTDANVTVWSNWEKADGKAVSILSMSSWWTAQFNFVQSGTFTGLACLESVYASTGSLATDAVSAGCTPSRENQRQHGGGSVGVDGRTKVFVVA